MTSEINYRRHNFSDNYSSDFRMTSDKNFSLCEQVLKHVHNFQLCCCLLKQIITAIFSQKDQNYSVILRLVNQAAAGALICVSQGKYDAYQTILNRISLFFSASIPNIWN